MGSSWEPVIGLEVHAQLLTQTKLFCGCSAAYGGSPNSHVCPVCLGLPGALPATNEAAIDMALGVGLALGCEPQTRSIFARKNYFYPDLAKGYQISQFELPINRGGVLSIEVDGERRDIRLQRIHLEEDAAKNLHGAGSAHHTRVDFNRAGVPLLEIVSEPDLGSPEEAEAYLRTLRELLLSLRANDGNLEEGSFRCDANVSLRPAGTTGLGTRTELKNINSFRFVRKALDYEIARQAAVLSAGEKVRQETRTWDENAQRTVGMRGKEESQDYRYFPDPDLPPLVVEAERISDARSRLPELPEARRKRWEQTLGLTPYDASVLSGHPDVAEYFERVAELSRAETPDVPAAQVGKKVANFIQAEVMRHVETTGVHASVPVSPNALAELLRLVEQDVINGKIAKEVFEEMVRSGSSASAVVQERGLAQVTDEAALAAEVRRVLSENPKQLAQYREGKKAVRGYFVGQVMKATRGKANPKIVNRLLDEQLEE